LNPLSAVICLALLSHLAGLSQAHSDRTAVEVGIKNFGCVNEKMYRGAQPKADHYSALAAQGMRSIIDLRRDGPEDERQLVESAGMKYYKIAMSDTSHPPHEKVEEFLRIVNDPANQPVFVHCRGGRHRTGALIAIYRVLHEGWTAQQAVEEMKRFDFNKGFGHGSLKDCVYEHYENLSQGESINR
jgi:protein tyrosine/serine phosphatase